MSIFSPGREERDSPGVTHDLKDTVASIATGADERDAHPSFPEVPFLQLAAAGALALPVPDPRGEQGRRASFAEEWRILRAVARADGSVGRILDGHFNGVERVSILVPEPCARPSSKPSPRGNYSWESGEPTRYQGRESRPDS
jgi:alkylation response protein AidB-like acyl-CoA dehydrogenase